VAAVCWRFCRVRQIFKVGWLVIRPVNKTLMAAVAELRLVRKTGIYVWSSSIYSISTGKVSCRLGMTIEGLYWRAQSGLYRALLVHVIHAGWALG
jgi:hypothetical protein